MCAYSVVSDYYMDQHRWPQGNPLDTMDGAAIRMLKEITDKLDALDKRLKDIECDDPKKRAFKKKLAKRLRETADQGTRPLTNPVGVAR